MDSINGKKFTRSSNGVDIQENGLNSIQLLQEYELIFQSLIIQSTLSIGKIIQSFSLKKPKYIKIYNIIKHKNKKKKIGLFDKLFLAQQLPIHNVLSLLFP